MRVTLVTGAGGYLGRRIAAAIPGTIRLDRARADVTRDDAFDAIGTRGVTHIVHAAAVTRFTVDRAAAAAVNVEGTRRVCEFAARCPDLRRLVLLSTLYTAGSREGVITETPHAEHHFVNHYEWSKWAAEHIVLTSGLPVSVLRIATLAADDDGGHVTQFNAVHNTLKLIYYGLLSLMPGDPDTPLPLATAEFTVAAILALLDAGPGVYHVCPGPERITTLGALLDTALAVFEKDPSFTRRRVLRPLFCDEAAFADLLAGARSLRSGAVYDALASVAPFAAQLYRPKVFANTALRRAWPGYAAPDPLDLTAAVAGYLVGTRWGREAR